MLHKLTSALAIFSLLQMGVTTAYSQVYPDTACETQAPLSGKPPAELNGQPSCGVTNKGSSTFASSICQGEFENKRKCFENRSGVFDDPRACVHGCDDHPIPVLYATCNATRHWIAANLCRSKGSPYYTIQKIFPDEDGNKCGYGWFTVACWSGQ